MKQVWVKDLNKASLEFRDTFMVTDVQVKQAKNGKHFATFKLHDKTGEASCIMFDYGIGENGSELLEDNKVLNLNGHVDEYQGKLNVKITKVSISLLEFKASHYEKASDYDPEIMYSQLVEHVNKFEHPWFRQVAFDLLTDEAVSQFKIAPAATGLHHAFKHGLLEHTTQMLDVGAKLFELPFFSVLNRDLCMFGIMFHDFGKIYEYSSTTGFKRTIQGLLVPHIPMMGAQIYSSCNKWNIPEIIRDYMMHVVLAHHGKIEWGSPTTFSCAEAAFVHYVDHMHGDIFGMLQKTWDSKDEVVKYGFGKDTCNVIVKPFSETLKEVEDARSNNQEPGREEIIVGGF